MDNISDVFSFIDNSCRLYRIFTSSEYYEDIRLKTILGVIDELKNGNLAEDDVFIRKEIIEIAEDAKLDRSYPSYELSQCDLMRMVEKVSCTEGQERDKWNECYAFIESYMFSTSQANSLALLRTILNKIKVFADDTNKYRFVDLLGFSLKYVCPDDFTSEKAKTLCGVIRNFIGARIFYGNIAKLFSIFGINITEESSIIGIDNTQGFAALYNQIDYCNAIKSNMGITRKQPQATSHQKWAILEILLNESGWNMGAWDKTKIAKFVSFLCGGSEQNIRDVLSGDKRTNDAVRIKDADVIKPYLEDIGLNRIYEKIKNNT